MYNFGRVYVIQLPTAGIARSLAADEVIMRVSAPATASLLVLAASFGIVGTDDKNEPNVIEMCRLSTDGTGGSTTTVEQTDLGDTAFGGTHSGIDADDWTAEPTVTDVLPQGGPFNLASGWHFSAAEFGRPIVVPPSGRIGFRIKDAISASMTFHASMTVLEVGT